MYRILFAAVSAILILVTVGSLSPAVAAADRYCLQGRRWGHPGNCQFATLQQCRAAASGTHASCGVNPRHAFGRSQQGRQ
ncbi:DUF3551 domain-containing protein [Bradyrhizobium sp. CB2312]|uniref:DUF3551 domain-containing protein n=1 Tax=Bradyrhizobium sp. CB2312 TaxID=3039155 RepID=UPI0024B1D660|nr:DUF3551 domain-containing protein [Bradyrhizobium sp. CB2312]WFU70019.1 DUF3551 domain-containing protein [Bradyrhizobium sp. CB2312]